MAIPPKPHNLPHTNPRQKRSEGIISLEREFGKQTELWRNETRILSSIQPKILDPHYRRIIGMGRAVLPFIFADLRDRGGQWYWALECITGENRAAHAESLPEAKKIWLEYAVKHKYL